MPSSEPRVPGTKGFACAGGRRQGRGTIWPLRPDDSLSAPASAVYRWYTGGMRLTGGPYVALAVLCQRIDLQPDGSADVIGIVDGVALTPVTAEEAPPLVLTVRAVIALRAGQARGAHTMGLRGIYPSGAEGLQASRVVQFTDARPAVTLNLPLELELPETGIYRFEITCDEALLTEITLTVERQPQ
jgi:hypothetical protein